MLENAVIKDSKFTREDGHYPEVHRWKQINIEIIKKTVRQRSYHLLETKYQITKAKLDGTQNL